jgi:sugar diacid utilization regulator
VYLPQMPDVGLELERILAPIVVHDDIYGYIWIIADDRPLNDLDRMAIESGAMVAALMILYQEASQNAEASLKGGLLSQLIQGDTRSETVLVDQALRYGVNLNAPFVLLMIDALPPGNHRMAASVSDAERESQSGLQVYRRVSRLAAQHGWRSVVGQFAGQVVMLTPADSDLAAITTALHEPAAQHDREAVRLRVAISAPQRGAGQVITAYAQCRDALHIAARLGDQRHTVYFESLGYLHALFRAGRDSLNANPYVPILRRLLPEQQADLFHTLEVYLDGGGNGVRTAEVLNIHRSTLNYRLGRIAEICGVELEDPLERTNLQIALKLLRLFEVEG